MLLFDLRMFLMRSYFTFRWGQGVRRKVAKRVSMYYFLFVPCPELLRRTEWNGMSSGSIGGEPLDYLMITLLLIKNKWVFNLFTIC